MDDLLVFGSANDPHVESVLGYIPKEYTVRVFDVFSRAGFKLSGGDEELRAYVSWNRLKGDNSESPEFIIDDYRRESFYYNSWAGLIRGVELNSVFTSLPDPKFALQSNNKATQLFAAKEVNLNIPTTIISNDVKAVLDTIKTGRILTKPLTATALKSEHLLFANIVSREFLDKRSKELSYVPQIFQEYIEKQYELRVNVVGDEVFALKINSQNAETSKVDWRRGGMSLDDYFEYKLPAAIEIKLIAFLKSLSLEWGVFDLIRDTAGSYVFLECNPDGQWHNENLPQSVEISKSMAAMLCRNIDSAKEKYV